MPIEERLRIVRLRVVASEGSDALGGLDPQRCDAADVLAVKDVEAADARGEMQLLRTEETACKGVRSQT